MLTHIRKASPEDAPILKALHAEGFSNYWDTNAFNDFFAVKGSVAFVLEHNDYKQQNPLGMLVLRVAGEHADIITLSVRKDYRRKGAARILMQRAIDEAVALGAQEMFLDVEDGNIAAMQLYKVFGFVQINRRKQYYKQKDGSYTDALVMTKKLA